MFWIMLACLGIFLLIHNTYIYILYVCIYIYAHTAWPVARKVNSCCVAFVLCPNLAYIDLWSPAIQENRHQDNRKIL